MDGYTPLSEAQPIDDTPANVPAAPSPSGYTLLADAQPIDDVPAANTAGIAPAVNRTFDGIPGNKMLASAGDATFNAIKNLDFSNWGKDYFDALGTRNKRDTDYDQNNPTVGRMLGATGDAAVSVPLAIATGGESLASQVGAGALQGFGHGALDGATQGTNLADSVNKAGQTGAVEGVLGAGLAGAAHYVPDAFSYLKNKVQGLVNPAQGVERSVAKALDGVSTDPAAAIPQADPAAEQTAKAARDASLQDMGPGTSAIDAGTDIQSDLVARQAALKAARDAATAPIAEARDSSTAKVDMKPVTDLIADKLKTAAGSQRTEIQGALNDLQRPPNSDLPTELQGGIRTSADELAASRAAINSRITAAVNAGNTGRNSAASHLIDIRDALDKQLNAVVPEAGQYTAAYAEHSKPLDIFDADTASGTAPVASAVDKTDFNSGLKTWPSQVAGKFFNGAPEAYDQLVQGLGGDKAAAAGTLHDYLVGQIKDPANGIIDAAGNINPAKYDALMAKNGGALMQASRDTAPGAKSLYQQFATAKSAQQTFDNAVTKNQLSDKIYNGGALEDGTGQITGKSLTSFLQGNQETLSRTMGPMAYARLKGIAQALTENPGMDKVGRLQAFAEPIVTGIVGRLGGAAAFAAKGAYKDVMANNAAIRQEVYNTMIKRAVVDPIYAAKLSTALPPIVAPASRAMSSGNARAIAAMLNNQAWSN